MTPTSTRRNPFGMTSCSLAESTRCELSLLVVFGVLFWFVVLVCCFGRFLVGLLSCGALGMDGFLRNGETGPVLGGVFFGKGWAWLMEVMCLFDL